jgi:hypothetical protein
MNPTAQGDGQAENSTEAPQTASDSPFPDQPQTPPSTTPIPEPISTPQTAEVQDPYQEQKTFQEGPAVQENQFDTASAGQVPQEPYNQVPTEASTAGQETQQIPSAQAPVTEPVAAQTDTTDLPQVFTSQASSPHDAVIDNSQKGSRKPLLFILLILFFILTLSGLGGLTYAVAYEKIKLEKYPDAQKRVSYFVMNLPFMPKSPKYLLAKTAMVHQDVTRQSFDISMAVDSADLSSSLGLSNLDIQAKGALDYSNPKNIFGNLEISFTKEFNMELIKKDEMLYFRLNKLPSLLFAFLGIGTVNFEPIMNKWVAYDTTPLETEARKSITSDREMDPLSEEFIDKNFEKYIDETILSKIKLSSDTEEGYAVHKLTLDADSELIDYLGKKLEETSRQKGNYVYDQGIAAEPAKFSDFIKRLKWEIYIDKETYYTRKVIFAIDLEYDSSDGLGAFSMGSMINPLASNNKAKIVLAAKFDKFGEEVVVEEPIESINFEEFTRLLSDTFSELYGGVFDSYESQVGQAADARIKTDLMQIEFALEYYKADCGKYPNELNDLANFPVSDGCSGEESYHREIPKSPDGSNYFYKASDDRNSFDLCANLENPTTITNTCPDETYNYHISSTKELMRTPYLP